MSFLSILARVKIYPPCVSQYSFMLSFPGTHGALSRIPMNNCSMHVKGSVVERALFDLEFEDQGGFTKDYKSHVRRQYMKNKMKVCYDWPLSGDGTLRQNGRKTLKMWKAMVQKGQSPEKWFSLDMRKLNSVSFRIVVIVNILHCRKICLRTLYSIHWKEGERLNSNKRLSENQSC